MSLFLSVNFGFSLSDTADVLSVIVQINWRNMFVFDPFDGEHLLKQPSKGSNLLPAC